MGSFTGIRWVRAALAAFALSFAPSACSDETCSGNDCTVGSCMPGESVCTSDGLSVVMCDVTGNKITERTCLDGMHCGPISGGRFDCVSDSDGGDAGAVGEGGDASDASAESAPGSDANADGTPPGSDATADGMSSDGADGAGLTDAPPSD